MERIKGDLHGHSIYSDGNSSVGQIVQFGLTKELGIIGVSDHKDIRAARELMYLAEENNFIPAVGLKANVKVPGTERSCHVVVTQFGELITKGYLKDCEALTNPDSKLENVLEMTKNHNALLIVPHPGIILINGFPFAPLNSYCKKLSDEDKNHFAIEVNNWMAKMFVGTEPVYSYIAKKIASKHNLPAVASTDYHFGEHIGNQSTVFPLSEPTGENIMLAIRNKQTYPDTATSMDAVTLAKLSVYIGKIKLSEANNHFNN